MSVSPSVNSFIKDFFAAGTAASISLALTAPIERIKIILQVQKISQRNECIGIIGCAHHVLHTQGVLSFWRGNLANTIRAFPTSSLTFALKEKFKPWFQKEIEDAEMDGLEHFYANVASGATAGLLSLCFVYPLDFTRTRLAADIDLGGGKNFNGILDCLVKIYRLDGMRGLYRGFAPSALGIVIYRGGYFGFYDTLCSSAANNHNLSFTLRFIIAQTAVACAALLAYPLDTIRRLMMMQSGLKRELWPYRNSFHCFHQIYHTQGISGFYRGSLSNILVGVGSALILVLFDEIRGLF